MLVTNVLFINQFPDRRADEAAGKRHSIAATLAHGVLLSAGLAASRLI